MTLYSFILNTNTKYVTKIIAKAHRGKGTIEYI
jgi:hypothetical protein